MGLINSQIEFIGIEKIKQKNLWNNISISCNLCYNVFYVYINMVMGLTLNAKC